jgi:hypothetical protein
MMLSAAGLQHFPANAPQKMRLKIQIHQSHLGGASTSSFVLIHIHHRARYVPVMF